MHLTLSIDFYGLVCAFVKNNKNKIYINKSDSEHFMHMVKKKGKIKMMTTGKNFISLLTNYKQLLDMRKQGENISKVFFLPLEATRSHTVGL